MENKFKCSNEWFYIYNLNKTHIVIINEYIKNYNKIVFRENLLNDLYYNYYTFKYIL